MNGSTTVTGIGESAPQRAAALIALAIAKREAELGSVPPRTSSTGGTTAANVPSQGGK